MITIAELTPRLYEMIAQASEMRGREVHYDHFRWCMSASTESQINMDQPYRSCKTNGKFKILGIEVELCDCIPYNTIELRYSIGSVSIASSTASQDSCPASHET